MAYVTRWNNQRLQISTYVKKLGSRFKLKMFFDSFPGPSERSIHLAKVEIKRVVKEEMIRLVRNKRLLTPLPLFVTELGE